MSPTPSPSPAGICSTPIKQRPPPSLKSKARALGFNFAFVTSAVVIHLSQVILLPLALIPGNDRKALRAGLRFTKDAVEAILRAVNKYAGPSTFVLTTDGSLNLDEMVEFDGRGRALSLKLAKHSVWISNHSQYQDWLVIWLLMSVGQVASGLCIIMKASLMWVPVVGPIMQCFHFDFISKTRPLQRPNSGMLQTAHRSQLDHSPFALLLFPEGTLLSKLTQPKSTAYAEKIGVAVPENLLLPRSTGLLYALRSLRALSPGVALYDLTIGYPGMHVGSFSQDYYSLQTVYGYGQSAGRIRLHLQEVKLADVPLGLANAGDLAGLTTDELEKACTDEDRKRFDDWIHERWAAKDALMRTFYETGQFTPGAAEGVELNLRFRAADAAVIATMLGGLALSLRVITWLWMHGVGLKGLAAGLLLAGLAWGR